jgi:hypothetical protein
MMSTSSYYNTATVKVVATTIQNTQVTMNVSTPCTGGNACLPNNIPINVSIKSNQDVMLVALYVTTTYNNISNTITEYEGLVGTNITASVTATSNAPYSPNAGCYVAVNIPVSVQAVVCVPYLIQYGLGVLAKNPASFGIALNIYNISPAELPRRFPNACTLVTAQTSATINTLCASPQPSDASSVPGVITSSTQLQMGMPTPETAVQSVFQIPAKYYAGAVVIPQTTSSGTGLYLYEVVFSPELFINGIVNLACGTQSNTCYDSNGNLYTPVDVWIHIPLSTVGLNDVSLKLMTITNIHNIPAAVVVNEYLGPLTLGSNAAQVFTNNGWALVQSLASGYYSYTYLVNSNMYIAVTPSGQQPPSGEMEPAVLILAIPTSQQVAPPVFMVDMNLLAYGISSNNQPILALIGLDYPNYSAYIVPTTDADKLTCTGIATAKNPFANTAVLVVGLPLYQVLGAYSANVWYVDVKQNNVGSAITVGAFINNDFKSGAAADILSATNLRHCRLGNNNVTLTGNDTLVLYILTPSTTSLELDAGYPLVIEVVVNYNNVGGNLIAQALYRITITPKIPPANITDAKVSTGQITITDLYIKNVFCAQPPPNCTHCAIPAICGTSITSGTPPLYVLNTVDLTLSYSPPSTLVVPNTISITNIQNLPIPNTAFTPITAAQPLMTVQVKACLGNAAIGIGHGNPTLITSKSLGLPTIRFNANVWNCSPTGISGANPDAVVLISPAYITVGGNNVTLSGQQPITQWASTLYLFVVPQIQSNGSVSLTFNDPDCAAVSNVQPTVVKLTQPTSVSLPTVGLPTTTASTLTTALTNSSVTYNILNWYPYQVCGPLTLVIKGGSTITISLGDACFVGYIIPTPSSVLLNPMPSGDVCSDYVDVFINNNMSTVITPSLLQPLIKSLLLEAVQQLLQDLQSQQASIRIDLPMNLVNEIRTLIGSAIGVVLEIGTMVFPLSCDETNTAYTCTLPAQQQMNFMRALQGVGQVQMCIYALNNPQVTACKSVTISSTTNPSVAAIPTLPYIPIVSVKTLTTKVTPDKKVKVQYSLVFVPRQSTSA